MFAFLRFALFPVAATLALHATAFATGHAHGAVPAGQRLHGPPPAPVVTAESFRGTATTPGGWAFGDDACLTAGGSGTPATSIPACGSAAPKDAAGTGALQLTPPVVSQDGFVFDKTPFPTKNGLTVTFSEYSFGASGAAGDGLALVLTDASRPIPVTIGGCCGSLGYAPYDSNGNDVVPLPNGYLGIGLDESGYYTAAMEGRVGGTPGLLPNAVTVRGAASGNAPYLFSTLNAAGGPGPLPFSLYTAGSNRPVARTVAVSLTASGMLSLTIDRHDGQGPVAYIPPTEVVGVAGEPALPTRVYVGFIAAGGGDDARHQIGDFSVAASSQPKVSVTTYHNDAGRTGWNANETILSTANVNAATFGLLHTVAVDGRVDAEPLVVPNEPIDGQGVHDAVYIATENDTVYTLDAQSGAVLQSRNLGLSIPTSQKDYDDNVYPTYGILSTPVVDVTNDAIYVVTDTNEGASAPDVYRLHKLALNNLSDLVPSVVIAPATTLSDGSPYTFPPQHERQRPGLLEANNTIYVAFGSTGDTHPTISRGAIAGFSATNLAPVTNDEYPNRLELATDPYYLSSIWQSGYGVAADSSGNIYFSTGNSDPYAPSYGPPYNYPDSVLKISGNLGSVLDSFTQYNYFAQDQGDGDFGSGGTMVVPDQTGVYPHLIVAGGKDGYAYVLNRDQLGGYTPNGPNKIVAEFTQGFCWCGPAYFVGADGTPRIVTGGGNGIQTWRLTDGSTFGISPEGQVPAANTDGQPDSGGSIPVVSSNGTAAGSAILWFVQRPNDTSVFALTLRAYDASNLSHQLFASTAGNWTNFNSNANVVPAVANGYVYVASNKQVQIFGLLGR